VAGGQTAQGESLAMDAHLLVGRQGLGRSASDGNQGKRTPGVDRETWPTPEAKSKAVLSLRRRGYQTEENPWEKRRRPFHLLDGLKRLTFLSKIII
jgi:hypothetical protein